MESALGFIIVTVLVLLLFRILPRPRNEIDENRQRESARKEYVAGELFKLIERDGWTCTHCRFQGIAHQDFRLSIGRSSCVICRKCGWIQEYPVEKPGKKTEQTDPDIPIEEGVAGDWTLTEGTGGLFTSDGSPPQSQTEFSWEAPLPLPSPPTPETSTELVPLPRGTTKTHSSGCGQTNGGSDDASGTRPSLTKYSDGDSPASDYLQGVLLIVLALALLSIFSVFPWYLFSDLFSDVGIELSVAPVALVVSIICLLLIPVIKAQGGKRLLAALYYQVGASNYLDSVGISKRLPRLPIAVTLRLLASISAIQLLHIAWYAVLFMAAALREFEHVGVLRFMVQIVPLCAFVIGFSLWCCWLCTGFALSRRSCSFEAFLPQPHDEIEVNCLVLQWHKRREWSIERIAAELNKQGFQTREGMAWDREKVKMLRKLLRMPPRNR